MEPIKIEGRFVDWMHRLAEGKEALPNCDGERHHYVPQFLLRRFRGGGKLFQLDKETGEVTETTAKEAAWHKDLYKVVSTTGEHDGVIEGFFALAENFAKEALDGLVRDEEALSNRDRGDLAFLVAIQEQRAPGFLEEFKIGLKQAAIAHLAVELANTKGKKRQKALEAYESLVSGGVEIVPPDQEVLRMATAALGETSQLINFLPWMVLKARPGSLFVSSDRPLTMYDMTPPGPWTAPAWQSSPHVEATLPLGRDLCLRIGPSQRQRLGFQQTRKQVDRVNLRTYGWATRYVYGPSREILDALHERADDAPKPIRKRMVLLEDTDTADPAVADRNEARGWPRYFEQVQEDGSRRLVSYEVIDTDDDVRRALAPRAGETLAEIRSPRSFRPVPGGAALGDIDTHAPS